MPIEDIRAYLGKDWLSVRNSIRAYLDTDISLLNTTNENLLATGGKQLRPLLSIVMARSCGGGRISDASIKLATASELMHNATLLHDDVADNADRRRGNPTLRKLMGPSVSVLVGDFWLVRSIKAILDSSSCSDRVIRLFAGTLSDLAEGELLQLQKAETCDTDMEDYMAIIFRKTASLFMVTSLTAAISVGATKDVEDAAAEYGRCVGLAFQMKDDILDYADGSVTGKDTGVDILEGKITLPLLGALGNVPETRGREIRSMLRNVDLCVRDEIVDFVRNNGGIEYACGVLDEYSARAVKALSGLPLSHDRDILAGIAEYAVRRNF